jgi:hypothetical protein
MPIIDPAAHFANDRIDTERLRALKISQGDLDKYHNSLPVEVDDPSQERHAFLELISNKKLSQDDESFVKAYLDARDPR